MALLGFLNPFRNVIEYTCGGALINRWYVLTAAHCITSRLGAPKEIVLDELNTSTDVDCDEQKSHCSRNQTFTPAEIHVHEEWKQRDLFDGNDIALIRLDRPARFHFDGLLGLPEPKNDDGTEQYASPICLPWNEDIFGFKYVPQLP